MSDEIKLKRASKEQRFALKEKEKIQKQKKDEFNQLVRGKVKLTGEEKSKVVKLNILQIVVVVVAVVIELLNGEGMIPDSVSMIAVIILLISIVAITSKIKKVTNKKKENKN